jgi:subtilisin family serine protease
VVLNFPFSFKILINPIQSRKNISLFAKAFLFFVSNYFVTTLAIAQVEIRVDPIGGGGEVQGSGSFSNNQEVTLQATAYSGYNFIGWSGDLAGKENPISFNAGSPIIAYAHFEKSDTSIVMIDGQPAIAGSFVGKLNENGRRSLRRRVNHLGRSTVFRRNQVLDDLVKITWNLDHNVSQGISEDNVTRDSLSQISKAKSAIKSVGIEKQIKDLLDDEYYEFIEPNWLLSPSVDTGYAMKKGGQWGLKNTGSDTVYNADSPPTGVKGLDTQAEKAWEKIGDKPGPIVAVIDTGVMYNHPYLEHAMWKNTGEIAGNGKDDDNNGFIDDVHGINAIKDKGGDPMDDHGHGTHVAGIIAAKGPISGLAQSSKIMALKFLDANSMGSTDDAIRCIDYAIDNGAKIINASYGGYAAEGFSRKTEMEALDRARAAGILVVAAAGNHAVNNDIDNDTTYVTYVNNKKIETEIKGRFFPASHAHDNVLSVAAIDRNGNLADFSNFGFERVDLAAPGHQILSTYVRNKKKKIKSIRYLDGTSMAAPFVAATAALLLTAEPNLSYFELRRRILDNVDPLSSLSGKVATGGMLRAFNALSPAEEVNLVTEISHSPTNPEVNSPFSLFVRLAKNGPVQNATVEAKLNNTTFSLLDNGGGADKTKNDGIYSQNIPTPDLSSFDVSVHIKIEDLVVTKSTSIKTVSRPSNDSISFASPIDNNKNITEGINHDATMETNELSFTKRLDSTVWYTWQPSRSGTAKLSTDGSSFDTTLAVYSGNPSSFSSLTPIGSNDDAGDNQFSSEVEFSADKNVKYYIQIGGKNGKSGSFKLHHPQPVKPVAPKQVLPPKILSPSIELTKIEGESFSATVKASGSEPLSYQWQHKGQNISGATEATLTRSLLTLEDSGAYSVVITNQKGAISAPQVNLSVRPSKEVADNDMVENAQPITVPKAKLTSITRNATGQNGEPDPTGKSSPFHSVWWKWTAPKNGTVTVSTAGSSFDTVLSAFELQDGFSGTRTISSFTPAADGKDLLVTLEGHGLPNGQIVEVSGITGYLSSEANFLISVRDANSFYLSGTATIENFSLSSNSTVKKAK